MKIAIVGSRTWNRTDRVKAFVDMLPADFIVVSGHGGNVDLAAEERADERGMSKSIFPAEWDKYGKKAGPIRNTTIAEYCDALIAFWNGSSSGTKDVLDKAQALGKPCFVIATESDFTDEALAAVLESLVFHDVYNNPKFLMAKGFVGEVIPVQEY